MFGRQILDIHKRRLKHPGIVICKILAYNAILKLPDNGPIMLRNAPIMLKVAPIMLKGLALSCQFFVL